MPTPIFTSIPPVFSRKDAEGRGIGDTYLARCVQSWRDCGFDPVTVNSVNEALHPLIADFGVEVVRVPRDARAITGRPHVFLQDLLDAAQGMSEERVCIVNADVEIDSPETPPSRLHALGSCEAIVLRRIDHDGTPDPATAPYAGGVDLVCAGTDALADTDCGTLVFGMPWWDHYLPLALAAHGAEFARTDALRLWHLAHGGRWDKAQHLHFGAEFLRLAVALAPCAAPRAATYLDDLARIARGAYGRSRSEAAIARVMARVAPGAGLHQRRMLRAVSARNEALLSSLAAGVARD